MGSCRKDESGKEKEINCHPRSLSCGALGRSMEGGNDDKEKTMTTAQLERWKGDFGNAYIERNIASQDSVGKRQVAWQKILNSFPLAPRSFLEIGCNVGINLRALSHLSKADLYGVEPNAVALNKLKTDNIVSSQNLHEGNIFQIPFKDESVECVFTSGVLIHVAPEDLDAAYRELYRVSSRYILSIELFAKNPETISYRGHDDMLFKRDFGLKWLEIFPDLVPIEQGFLWLPITGVDDATWWLFEKRGV